MSATANPTRIVPIDTRRARGRHRAPRLTARLRVGAAAYIRLRVEILTVTAAAGAVLWAGHGITL